MTARNAEQFADALATELVWRKKELTALRWMVENGDLARDRRSAVIRGAIALLYAHWEGFIKAAGRLYLEFVHFQRLHYRSVSRNFVALGVRKLLSRASATEKANAHLDVVEFFQSRMDERCNLPYRDGIKTDSNLSSRVLREIVQVLGLDYSEFATKEKLLDDLLVHRRNTIAHGEYLDTSVDDYLDLHEQVLAMMERFRKQVDNAVAMKKYLSDAPAD